MDLGDIVQSGRKVLLHCCCAPCSGAVVEHLVRNGILPVLFFSNSNITPKAEYDLRRGELVRYATLFGLRTVDDDYDHADWLSSVVAGDPSIASAPERGERCLRCFRYRLERAAAFAEANGLDILTTTLASSRWKSLEQVDRAGTEACSLHPGVEWWGRNWRKGGLQPRRAEIIKEQGFYNQTFCGCEFSRYETE